MTKPFIIYGLPRTGSSMIYQMFTDVLKDTKQNHFLHEYFDSLLVVESIDPIIIRAKFSKEDDHRRISLNEKFNILKNNDPKKYLIKLCWILSGDSPAEGTTVEDSFQYNKEVFDWCNDNYQFICTERYDLKSLCLSFILGIHTQIWFITTQELYNLYTKNMNEAYNFTITENEILTTKNLITSYYEDKKNIKNLAGTIFYEDFIIQKENVLNHFNIKKPNNYIYQSRFIKQNYNYYSSIQNAEEVKFWIEKHITPLQFVT